jgi:SET domain-containing protein
MAATRERTYVVKKSNIHGRGVFAARDIRKGERIVEYTGERISTKEADRRYAKLPDNGHTMLFTVNDKIVIDATQRGSSHSCSGNCHAVEEEDRIYIEARRDIPAGTELSYDYQLDFDGRITQAAKRLYGCRCGARNCRGTMLYRRGMRPLRTTGKSRR